MHRLPLVVFLAFLLGAAFAAPALETLRVAQDGAPGTLPSLDAARDAIRAMKTAGGLPAGGVRVEIAPGTYRLAAPFTLGAEDTGTAEAPILYAASEKGNTILSGGMAVDAFAPVTDQALLDTLDPAARGNVVAADLKVLGVTEYGTPKGGGLEVFFRGEPMTLSRWPNDDFVRIKDIVVQDGHQIHGIPGSKTGQFVYDGDRPTRWVNAPDAWLHGYWFWDWSDERQPIAKIDPALSQITLKEPYHGYGYRKGQWYYAYNLLCEIDTPGEWYLDRTAGLLYFWPPAPIQPGDVIVSNTENLVKLADVSHVTLQGLVFEYSRALMASVSGGEACRIEACTFRNGGNNAVSVSGGANHTVFGCDIYAMGGAGISLSAGDRVTLTPANLVAENNHIHHYGRFYRMYQGAISLGGVGNRAAHNLIHDAPHTAIFFGGNDHVIEFNEIYRVCLESNDAGAMYAGRDWTMRGHVIRDNYLHDIDGFEHKGCVGVYLDDMFCSAEISSNLFKNVCMAAFIGGGRDNQIVNNIFVDCKPALHIDARAMNWAGYHADEWIAEGQEKGTFKGVKYKDPPYSTRFPQLPGMLDDEPKSPKGNLIARNVCVGRWDDSIEEIARPYLNFENNLTEGDPGFVDAANSDYRLKPDSPAFALGFVPFPIEKIGLYEDPGRAQWPVEKQ